MARVSDLDPARSREFDPARSEGSGSRYQRSFSGMVGAMIVTLVVIAAFVLFRALNREELEVRPEQVDWQGSVKYIQSQGGAVWYPSAQPAGWTATSAEYKPGARALWDIGFLTDDGEFVGLHEEDASVDELISELVDEDATEGDEVVLAEVTWRSFTDDGGDYGLATEHGSETVVVYGSEDPEVIRDLAASLTTEPLR